MRIAENPFTNVCLKRRKKLRVTDLAAKIRNTKISKL